MRQLTPKQSAYVTKTTAEKAYMAIRGAYLDGAVSDAQMQKARTTYLAYAVAQRTAANLLTANPPGDAGAYILEASRLGIEVIKLAVELGVIEIVEDTN
jgi:hypothetical protein